METNPEYSSEGLMLKLKLQYFGHLMLRADTGKSPDAGKDWRQEEKGTTDDKMGGWHRRLNGHEFEQAPGDSEGQGSLVCCSPWGRKESDTTEQLNNNHIYTFIFLGACIFKLEHIHTKISTSKMKYIKWPGRAKSLLRRLWVGQKTLKRNSCFIPYPLPL